MRTNVRASGAGVTRTFEGAVAKKLSPVMQLRRSLLGFLLWEDQFYEDGQTIADRIAKLSLEVEPDTVMQLAIEARTLFKLRHAPLWVAKALAGGDEIQRRVCGQLLPQIIQRPDELMEFLALYWNGQTDRKKASPLSSQVKKGLARAFQQFNEFQLTRYRAEDKGIKLRDVMFLVAPVPPTSKMAKVYKQLADKQLRQEEGMTWEEKLSAGREETKQESWTQLLEENKIAAGALLKNLRNMLQENVDIDLIRQALGTMKTERVLPFRFITAARYAPRLEQELEQAMFKCLADMPKLKGKTALIIDRSGSMVQHKISAKSELDRLDAASALAMLIREICDEVRIYTFSDEVQEVPARRGFGLRDAIRQAPDGASFGGKAVQQANRDGYDRIIVLTDGQWHSLADEAQNRHIRNNAWGHGLGTVYQGNVTGQFILERPAVEVSPVPLTEKAYLVNIASQVNSVGSNRWHMIDGWSEQIVSYIQALEQLDQ